MRRLHTLYRSEQDHRDHEQQRTETPSALPIPLLFHNSFPQVLDHATAQSFRSFYFQSISTQTGLAQPSAKIPSSSLCTLRKEGYGRRRKRSGPDHAISGPDQ